MQLSCIVQTHYKLMISKHLPPSFNLGLIGLFATVLLASCGGSSGGDVTATPSTLTSTDPSTSRDPDTFVVDNQTGSDTNTFAEAALSGGGAWQSLQFALDQAQPGDVIQVMHTGQAYSGTMTSSAVDPAAIVISVSGEPGLPVIIEGVPDAGGNLPVIDQGRTSPDADSPVAGLLLDCVDHVIIRNFEIRNSNDAGITTSLSGCDHQNITVENNHIHSITGIGYVAGIRLIQTRDSLVQGNRLHDITTSTTLTTEDPAALVTPASATSNIRLAQNDIGDVDVAVHIRGRGAQALDGITVENNTMHGIETGMLITADAAQPAAVNNTTFTSNLVLDAELPSDEGRAVDVQLGTSTVQSDALDISSNTLVNVDQPVRTAGMTALVILENIITGSDADLLISVNPITPTIDNGFASIDNNLFFDNATTSWTLANGGADENRYLSLPSWQQAFSVSSHPELTADPDSLSLQADPEFTDPTQHDFSLSITSPARTLGTSGGEIGAYSDGVTPGAPD